MSSIVVAGDTSGSVTLQAPAVAGASVLTLPVATDTLVGKTTTDTLTNKTLTSPVINGMASSILTSGTAQASTSGTSIDFTGIPSWVKRITVMFNGVSTNSTSNFLIQIGSGSILTTGYVGCAQNQVATMVLASAVTGFPLMPTTVAAYIFYGTAILTNFSGNGWSLFGQMLPTSGNLNWATGTNTTLAGALDRVRITTVNGTDTFDAGSINIMYE
jgi:hypothetical protein